MKKNYTDYSLIQKYKNLKSLIRYYQSQLGECDTPLSEMDLEIREKSLFSHLDLEVISNQTLEKKKYYSSVLSSTQVTLEELKFRNDFDIDYVTHIITIEENRCIEVLGRASTDTNNNAEYGTFCTIL